MVRSSTDGYDGLDSYNSFILLVGFELNASIAVHKSIAYHSEKKKENKRQVLE
ncbi:MAG: hypothetical protein IPO92_05505 [Saprospiraceae bacterium]|nr:hypothetical protein [Saprospiraceae bacterium]